MDEHIISREQRDIMNPAVDHMADALEKAGSSGFMAVHGKYGKIMSVRWVTPEEMAAEILAKELATTN